MGPQMAALTCSCIRAHFFFARRHLFHFPSKYGMMCGEYQSEVSYARFHPQKL